MDRSKLPIIFFLIAILALAAFFRLYKLDSIPPGLYPDVAINGNDALDILQTGKLKVFYPENNGREGLFFWLIAFSFWIFGPSVWAIKIVAALFGIFTVLGTYLLTKELLSFGNWKLEIGNWKKEAIALSASFFLAISFWHVNFSRIGFRAIMVPFFLVFGFYFLWRGFRSKRIYNFIISGIFLGLGFYSYISYRFVIFILAAAFLSWWLTYKKENNLKQFWKFAVYSLLFIFISALPIGIYFLTHPQDFFGRASGVSVFSQPNPLFEFLKSLVLNLGMFNVYGDGNWRHNFSGSPQLLWPVGIFFLIGFILAIKEIVRNRNNWSLAIGYWLLVVWFFSMLLPGALGYEGNPHALRTIGVIPAAFIFAGLGAFWSYEKIKNIYKTKGNKFLFYFFISIFLLSLVVAEYDKYFVQWANKQETKDAFSENFVKVGNYLNSLGGGIEKYVVVNQVGVLAPYGNGLLAPMPAQTPIFIERMKYGKTRAVYIMPEDIVKIKTGKSAVFITLQYDEALLGEIIFRFPDGKLEKDQGIWVYKINN